MLAPVGVQRGGMCADLLDRKHVELLCDAASLKLLGARARAAEDADWDAEYDDYILAVHVVRDLDEAMEFIAAHSTQHSECIVTESYAKVLWLFHSRHRTAHR